MTVRFSRPDSLAGDEGLESEKIVVNVWVIKWFYYVRVVLYRVVLGCEWPSGCAQCIRP